jgi:c-di-GMP-binding flagellar brake protein YcgR
MIRERRRYFRHPVELPATITFSEGDKLKARVANISEGGMAIFFRGHLPKGGVSTVNLQLPGVATLLEPKVQIAWMDDSGRAGLRFIDMPRESHEQLNLWLAGQQGEQPQKTEKPRR